MNNLFNTNNNLSNDSPKVINPAFKSGTDLSNDPTATISSIDINNVDIINSNNLIAKEFSKSDKKIIASRIDQIKHKKIHLKIFKIIHDDADNYTLNTNGVFLNINNLKDSTLTKIENVLNLYDNIKEQKTNNKWTSILQNQYDNTSSNNNNDKLSNYEKNLVKKQQSYISEEVSYWGASPSTTEVTITNINGVSDL